MEHEGVDFLGAGWRFPLGFDGRGAVAAVAYEDAVRQAIWMILGTSPGERVMRPDFGCNLQELVFAPNGAATAGLVASHVRDALLRWEPRIELLGASAAPDPLDPGRLLIEIDYRVRATNSRFNMVYPFYLE